VEAVAWVGLRVSRRGVMLKSMKEKKVRGRSTSVEAMLRRAAPSVKPLQKAALWVVTLKVELDAIPVMPVNRLEV
jgi:hypothetical protein